MNDEAAKDIMRAISSIARRNGIMEDEVINIMREICKNNS